MPGAICSAHSRTSPKSNVFDYIYYIVYIYTENPRFLHRSFLTFLIYYMNTETWYTICFIYCNRIRATFAHFDTAGPSLRGCPLLTSKGRAACGPDRSPKQQGDNFAGVFMSVGPPVRDGQGSGRFNPARGPSPFLALQSRATCPIFDFSRSRV